MLDLKVLFNELIRFEIELWDSVDERLRRDCGLPLSRFEPMRVIARLGECRVQDIASELAITVGGVSKLVDRIETSGYCRRRQNPRDRRSSIITLTPAGRRLLAETTTVFEDELAIRLVSAVSEPSLEHFLTTLRQLRSAARSTGSAAV